MANQAIEQIWSDYHSSLHGFIQSRVNDLAAADDILQDVFIKIHSKMATLKENNKLRSWIFQVARNTIIDHYRSRRMAYELPHTLAGSDSEPHIETRQEIASWLEPMIQNLPEHYRKILMLTEIEGLKQNKVAEMEGLSLSGVKSRVQRGRAMMKETLMDCCQFEYDHQGTVMDYEQKGADCRNC